MKIQEFAVKYCPDLLDRAKREATLFDLSDFQYDEEIVEEDGTRVKVLDTPSFQIPLSDVLGMTREEFATVWPQEECLDLYDRYISTLTITEGPEVLQEVQQAIRREQEKLSLYSQIPMEF